MLMNFNIVKINLDMKVVSYSFNLLLYTMFLVFSLQTSLALVLVFCALVSLSNSSCFQELLKPGKLKYTY